MISIVDRCYYAIITITKIMIMHAAITLLCHCVTVTSSEASPPYQVYKNILNVQLSVRVQFPCLLSNGGRCFCCNSALFQAGDSKSRDPSVLTDIPQARNDFLTTSGETNFQASLHPL